MTTIFMPQRALQEIFNECDRFDKEETGGRLIGVFGEAAGNLTLRVLGVIEAGPNAKRTAVSFFQDGEYQEPIFRRIEKRVRNINHLGNWHSHHCNALKTLSQGDLYTYRKIVNSPNHAVDFFYALLVTEKFKHGGYAMRHFIFRRGISGFREVAQSNVKMVDDSLLWPRA
jgi:hypothetical protein